MAVLMGDLKPGELFHVMPGGSVWVYEGLGWFHMDWPGAAHRACNANTDMVVFRAGEVAHG